MAKYKEPQTMVELHRIREQMYRETQGMTHEEWAKYIHRRAQAVVQKYGLKLKRVRRKAVAPPPS